MLSFSVDNVNSVNSPLHNFHNIKSNFLYKIELLAFAYASIFKSLLENVTLRNHNSFEKYGNYIHVLTPTINEDPFQEDIKIEFTFGQLHAVSCGSRGIESISTLQLAAIFETRIWLILFVIVLLVIFCSKHLIGRSLPNSLLSLIKVLLEQGCFLKITKELTK